MELVDTLVLGTSAFGMRVRVPRKANPFGTLDLKPLRSLPTRFVSYTLKMCKKPLWFFYLEFKNIAIEPSILLYTGLFNEIAIGVHLF